ncbi:MAG: heparinase II/III family protein, partial [Ignavibacteriae bacterium]|nr:heparinase II/III family protein [Ignavibacteriota bacterium]
DEPFLERKLTGKRLLSVSREMLNRTTLFGVIYMMEKDSKILKRINDELVTVCKFSDWNPSHYLDVAEMSTAVAFALDWTAGDLPDSTKELALNALIEKGINPSYEKPQGWINGTHNWNQVCNGGMIAASIAIAEKDPELAAKTINRSLEGMPHALVKYNPDGVYPEGSTYWDYGTSYTIITIEMLKSAFNADFDLSDFPGFLKSAYFKVLCDAPSGMYFNFSDCGDGRNNIGNFNLAWFASRMGKEIFFEKERFLLPAEEMTNLPRLAAPALVWISQFEPKNKEAFPTAWKGEGDNPIVIFNGGENDQHHYYFGGKGGKATNNHGNMDAGSFVFELNGVRWVVDPGNQSYYELEKTGFDLWCKDQNCQRWTLITKNNFGHSTISVNNQLFINKGFAPLLTFEDRINPSASFDLTEVYGKNLKKAIRSFEKDSPTSLLITDQFEISQTTETITWQLITTADVEIIQGGAILHQDSKELRIENISHPNLTFSVISLDPAPLKLDRQIEGLKRIELRIPVWTLETGKGEIKIRLTE